MSLIAVFNDAHPDTARPDARPALLGFVSDIKTKMQQVERVIILGDSLGSSYVTPASALEADPFMAQWYAGLKSLGDTRPVDIVNGNHDPDDNADWPRLRELVRGKHTTFRGTWFDGAAIGLPRVLFTHGHQDFFDPSTKWWEFLLHTGEAVLGKPRLSKVTEWVLRIWFRKTQYATPAAAKAAGDLDAYHAMIGVINQRRQKWLFQSEEFDTMLCGHTHFDSTWTKPLSGKMLVDTGAMDAAGNMTYAVIDPAARRFEHVKYP